MEFANIPPNTVAIPFSRPDKKAVGSYYYRKDAGSDVLFRQGIEELFPLLIRSLEKGKNDNRISL